MSNPKYRDPAIRWDVEISAALPAEIPILRAPIGGGSWVFISLSDSPTTALTHWHDKRTVPCTGPDHGCICGVLAVSQRRLAYLVGWDPVATRLCIVELTSNAVRESRGQVDVMFESLAGRAFRIYRRGGRPTSPVLIDPAIPLKLDYDLPRCFDLRDALSRIWHGKGK